MTLVRCETVRSLRPLSYDSQTQARYELDGFGTGERWLGESVKDEALGGSIAAGIENWRTQVQGPRRSAHWGAEYSRGSPMLTCASGLGGDGVPA